MADDKKPGAGDPKAGDKSTDTKPEDQLYDKGKGGADDKKDPEKKEPEKKADDKAADDKGDDKGGKKEPPAGSDDKGDKDDKGSDDPDSKVPEKYELQRPEDETFTDGDMADYADAAKAMGVTLGQAKKLVEFQVARRTAVREGFIAELKADKDLGGDRLQTSVDVANKGLKAFLKDSPQEEQDIVIGLLQRSGFANHKALVRAFARLGKSTAEDKPDHSGKGGAGDTRTAAERLYGTK